MLYYLTEKNCRFVPQNRQQNIWATSQKAVLFRYFLQKFHEGFEGLETSAKLAEMPIRSLGHATGKARYSCKFENNAVFDLSKGTKEHGNNFVSTYVCIELLYGTYLVLFWHKKEIKPLL